MQPVRPCLFICSCAAVQAHLHAQRATHTFCWNWPTTLPGACAEGMRWAHGGRRGTALASKQADGGQPSGPSHALLLLLRPNFPSPCPAACERAPRPFKQRDGSPGRSRQRGRPVGSWRGRTQAGSNPAGRGSAHSRARGSPVDRISHHPWLGHIRLLLLSPAIPQRVPRRAALPAPSRNPLRDPPCFTGCSPTPA